MIGMKKKKEQSLKRTNTQRRRQKKQGKNKAKKKPRRKRPEKKNELTTDNALKIKTNRWEAQTEPKYRPDQGINTEKPNQKSRCIYICADGGSNGFRQPSTQGAMRRGAERLATKEVENKKKNWLRCVWGAAPTKQKKKIWKCNDRWVTNISRPWNEYLFEAIYPTPTYYSRVPSIHPYGIKAPATSKAKKKIETD